MRNRGYSSDIDRYGTAGWYGFGLGPVWPGSIATTTSTVPELLTRLERAIDGEYNAMRTYGALMDMTPDEDFRGILQSIRHDESTHFQRFSHIYAHLTRGMRPTLTEKPLPEGFATGIEESIQDELTDSKFYQETSLYAPDKVIKRMLMYASHDEARHSVWFSYIWNKPLHN